MAPILETLQKFHPLEPAAGLAGWYRYESVTPKFRFHYYVKAAAVGGALFQVTIRGDYPPAAVAEICATIDRLESSLTAVEAPRKLQTPEWHTVGFDALMVLPPDFHNSFAAQDAELAARTFVIFPVYDCEFFAAESKEAVEVLRRTSVPTLDWTRSPAPRVAMRFSNPRTGTGSVGSHRGIADQVVALKEAAALVNSPGAFVELENFRHQVLRISSTGPSLVVVSEAGETLATLTADQVAEWVSRFLTHGL